MGFACRIGGARAMFAGPLGGHVAGAIDQAFGAEGDWEGVAARCYGELEAAGWSELKRRAVETLGEDAVPNLLALGDDGRGVFLPAHVRAVALPLPQGAPLCCAALHGLRRELAEFAERWELPLDDESLEAILKGADDGGVADAPEVVVFARLALAANEALRRDCPLWLVGAGD